MNLKTWRTEVKRWSRKRLAIELDLAEANSVYRYEVGTRTPHPTVMARIYRLSRGLVTPNDFILHRR